MLGPIFAREFLTVPRTEKHFWSRVAALGGLWTLGVTAWLATNALGPTLSLGETARFGRLLFVLYAAVALVLVIFFAALSAAGTVSREKDRRTFVLLLLSDLRDHEIVLGKMLGSLLPIMLLLIGMAPILAMVMLLGGMLPSQVALTWLVLFASGLAAGSLGGLVALWRDRTSQALAVAVLGIVLYFCLTRAVVAIGQFAYPAVDWVGVLNWCDPVAALIATVEPASDHPRAIPPAVGFVAFMSALAVLLNAIGIWRLRDWNPGREPVMQPETKEDADTDAVERKTAHAAPGAERRVWANPVLWREIRTRAYGRRPFLVKLLYFVVLGLICYWAFAAVGGTRVPFQAAYGLIPVAFLSFLLIAAQAVTAITSERDTGALDLLLVTDLTPREFIFGKLVGVAFNVKEYLTPPLVLAVVYAAMGMLASPPRNAPQMGASLNAQSLAAVLGGLVLLLSFVLIFGVFIALRVGNSRQAIAHALGTVFFLSVGTIVCIYLILINPGTFEYQFLSFALFLVAGIGGLLWVLSGELPSPALTIAAVALPLCTFYCVTNVLVAKPGSTESAPPLVPFLVIAASFGFGIAAMLIPLLSEFDVALGRTRADD